ncbi:MAG: FAD-dependent oxidoreductase [Eggerthellaceae bacterium]|nr:FAD-dependent oxidoreductase [Eggerthellaceae bacterium]
MENVEQAASGADAPSVVVVGAGVVGCCIARELGRYAVQVTVLEAGDDLACGSTRANSGIVHAGFDPLPGTNKARFNARGSALYPQWAAELGFPFLRNGSMVVAFSDEEMAGLDELLQRGRANGIEGLRIVGAEEARGLESSLSDRAKGALVAETGGICDPYGVALAAAENAAANGVRFLFDQQVEAIEPIAVPEGSCNAGAPLWRVRTRQGLSLDACAVVNAAGIHSDELNNLVSGRKLSITPVRGDYILFEPALGGTFHHTMFQVPGPAGKGVLVSPTVHGNLFVGPDAVPQESKDDLGTSREGLGFIIEKARRTWPECSTRGMITNFAGLRASGESHDFVVGEAPDAPRFYNAACIDSPGLTAAPAIAEELASQVADALGAAGNPSFDPHRAPVKPLALMDDERDVRAAVAADPAWGNIVCSCRKVSEGEIVAALRGPLPVLSLDALKWRCGAMMGECHAGFCTPKILRIVCRELGCAPEEVDKRLRGSWMVASSRPDYVETARAEEGVWPKAAGPADFYDVAVVGAGAAGMAAAKAAADGGARVLMVDRGTRLGGILCQCVHSGFGLERYKEELTGPEYAEREGAELAGLGIDSMEGATVLTAQREGSGAGALFRLGIDVPSGFRSVTCRALVLATGSRERGFGALNVAGERPSGIYTAGSAQSLINLQGCLPGRRALVLGSGDIGLIMARRMALEGMEVLGVHEIMPYPSGLRRNIVQCLDDFGIPLTLSSTVTRVEGSRRLEACWVQAVDPETRTPIPGTDRRIECDTLVLSVGLIPENKLADMLGCQRDRATGGPKVDGSFMTSVPGVFSCGNSLHIHDLADWASAEGDVAGAAAAQWARAGQPAGGRREVAVIAGEGVGHVVPQRLAIDAADGAQLEFRVSSVMRGAEFQAVGIAVDGSQEVLAKGRALIAVPAEMARLRLRGAEISRFDSIEVRARVR